MAAAMTRTSTSSVVPMWYETVMAALPRSRVVLGLVNEVCNSAVKYGDIQQHMGRAYMYSLRGSHSYLEQSKVALTAARRSRGYHVEPPWEPLFSLEQSQVGLLVGLSVVLSVGLS
eukprot:scaffold131063_cov43-Attheya_sp.AAC.1